MNKKDERLADSRLEKMGVTPRIYHFRGDESEPFTAITIAHNVLSKRRITHILDFIQSDLNSNTEGYFNPATHALEIYTKIMCMVSPSAISMIHSIASVEGLLRKVGCGSIYNKRGNRKW